MTHTTRFFTCTGLLVTVALGGMYATSAPPESMDKRSVQLSETEAEAVRGFEKKLKEYAVLHDEMEQNLEPLGDEATPEEIDEHREQLRARIKSARVGAKRGDFFTPGMESLIRRVCSTKANGVDGEQLTSTIDDENPGRMPTVTVNDRYPDGVPVTTMPSQLLEALPKLNKYMEYRFVGKKLILVDAGAGMVLDMTPDVLP
jgi:hypothetical protein